MLAVYRRELKKCIRNVIDTLKFRWRVLVNGGYAGSSIIVTHPEYIKIGKKVRIKKNYRIECYPKFAGIKLHPKIIFEDGVIIGHNLTIFWGATVRIGADTIFAGNVTLISENHGKNPISDVPYHAQPLTTGPISIGKGCWLGQNVSVLPNVKIGEKCIIATNAVVSRDIPDYCIAAGIPAKVVKKYNFKNQKWEKVSE